RRARRAGHGWITVGGRGGRGGARGGRRGASGAHPRPTRPGAVRAPAPVGGLVTAGLAVGLLVLVLGVVVGRARTPVPPAEVPVPTVPWGALRRVRGDRSPVLELHRLRASLAAGATAPQALAALADGTGAWSTSATVA